MDTLGLGLVKLDERSMERILYKLEKDEIKADNVKHNLTFKVGFEYLTH